MSHSPYICVLHINKRGVMDGDHFSFLVTLFSFVVTVWSKWEDNDIDATIMFSLSLLHPMTVVHKKLSEEAIHQPVDRHQCLIIQRNGLFVVSYWFSRCLCFCDRLLCVLKTELCATMQLSSISKYQYQAATIESHTWLRFPSIKCFV